MRGQTTDEARAELEVATNGLITLYQVRPPA